MTLNYLVFNSFKYKQPSLYKYFCFFNPLISLTYVLVEMIFLHFKVLFAQLRAFVAHSKNSEAVMSNF